jgi:predicted Zn-dependent protease
MESNPSGSVSFKTVLLHEIGHILGLFHSHSIESVMYEYIFTNQVKQIIEIDRNDLNEIYSKLCQTKKIFKRKKKIYMLD